MRLAAMIGLEVPLHGLVYSKDGSFAYFIRRFDRIGRGGKLPLEDFAQLTGKDRDTKYRSSMEQVSAVIDRFCTFPGDITQSCGRSKIEGVSYRCNLS